jgi:GAF domain-containing protein
MSASQPDPTSSLFAEVALVFAEAPGFDQTVEEVARLSQEMLACDFASVTLRRDGALETVAATHPDVAKADALQYEFHEGPCYDAATDEGTFLSDQVGVDPRWPQWGPRAAELGLNSLLGINLEVHDQTFGALNLYARAARTFDDDDVALARIFAAHASVALAAASQVTNLKRAIDTRHVIGQAQGILMERFHVNDIAAFNVLRRLSQDRNVKLRVIAQEIVDEPHV